jgi:methylglutamate dehydrogenase subunit C
MPGSGIVDVEGSKAVRRVKLGGAHGVAIDCDAVGMAGGWSPVVHLSSHGGIKPRYDDAIAGFVPGGFPASHFGAGAMMGSFGLTAAIAEGAQRRCLRRIRCRLRQDAAGLCA